MAKIKCKVLKHFGAYQEFEAGEVVGLPESQFKQLVATNTVAPINSNDDAKDKSFKDGKNKKVR